MIATINDICDYTLVMPLPRFIANPSNLITSHRAVCDGFLAQALAKTQQATPYVEDALRFYAALKDINSIDRLLDQMDIWSDLVAAAGFSEKARAHLTNEELKSALQKVLKTIERADEWREEVFYRYLLTKGDSLGGSMRNYTGALAGQEFGTAVLHALSEHGVAPDITTTPNSQKIKEIAWPRRLLLFDKTPSLIGKNIDVILLNTSSWRGPPRKSPPSAFVAFGELKGGIDPAGADEHWKTANSALDRIRQCFTAHRIPPLFFVGAAIEVAMAKEIFNQLLDERLTYAANLTVQEQLADLADWLVAL